jgi:hypothetical protein
MITGFLIRNVKDQYDIQDPDQQTPAELQQRQLDC